MSAGLGDLIDADRAPALLADGFGAVYGPIYSRLDYLLFCDTAAGRIIKWKNGVASVFRENSTAVALSYDHQGRLLACERDRITRTNRSGQITVLADRLHSPRGVVYAIDGSVYFSDAALEAPAIHQITRHGQVRVVSRDCQLPMGVALSADHQKLFASDALGRQIWVFDIAEDGALRAGRVFAAGLARGLRTDQSGNVWVAEDDAIAVYNGGADRMGAIPLPEDPSNLTWGDRSGEHGYNFPNIYVTAGHSLYRIETKMKGTHTY